MWWLYNKNEIKAKIEQNRNEFMKLKLLKIKKFVIFGDKSAIFPLNFVAQKASIKHEFWRIRQKYALEKKSNKKYMFLKFIRLGKLGIKKLKVANKQ